MQNENKMVVSEHKFIFREQTTMIQDFEIQHVNVPARTRPPYEAPPPASTRAEAQAA